MPGNHIQILPDTYFICCDWLRGGSAASTAEIASAQLGNIIWVFALFFFAFDGLRSNRALVPAVAAVASLSWDIAFWLTIDHYDPASGSGKVVFLSYLLLDTIIFTQVVLWGRWHFRYEFSRSGYALACLAALAVAVTGQWAFIRFLIYFLDGFENYGSLVEFFTGFVTTSIASTAFVLYFLGFPSGRLNSWRGALGAAVATFLISLANMSALQRKFGSFHAIEATFWWITWEIFITLFAVLMTIAYARLTWKAARKAVAEDEGDHLEGLS